MTKSIMLFLSAALFAVAADVGAEKEVMAAMHGWRQAMVKKDRTTLERLLHADLTYTHSNGRNETRSEVVQSVTTGPMTHEAIELGETKVRVYGNTALVKGIVDFRNRTGSEVSNAHLNVLHVWIKGAQGWQMVARQAIRLTS